MNKDTLRFLAFSTFHGLSFAVTLIASVLGSMAVSIKTGRMLQAAYPHANEWVLVLSITALLVGLLVFISWKVLLPYQDWVEPRLCRTCWNKYYAKR